MPEVGCCNKPGPITRRPAPIPLSGLSCAFWMRFPCFSVVTDWNGEIAAVLIAGSESNGSFGCLRCSA